MASRILAYLLYGYIWLVYFSAKWTGRLLYENKAVLASCADKKPGNQQGFILAFWHGRLAMMPVLSHVRHADVCVMISRHRDGEFIANIAKRFGLKAIRGSSDRKKSDPKGAKNRGGRHVLSEAVRALRAGQVVVMTPDGPRGPRMHLQEGVISLARKTGVPVIPVAFSSSFALEVRSWDRFLCPFPFGKLYFTFGDPIFFSMAEAVEIQVQRLEMQMVALTQQADLAVGREIVLPA